MHNIDQGWIQQNKSVGGGGGGVKMVCYDIVMPQLLLIQRYGGTFNICMYTF